MKVTYKHKYIHVKETMLNIVGHGTRLSYYGAVLQEECFGGCQEELQGQISGFLIGGTRLNYSCVGSPC